MDSPKLPGVELQFQTGQRSAEKMLVPCCVQRYIVPLRFDPVDLIRLEKEDAASGFYDHPVEIFATRPSICYQRQQALTEITISFAANLPAGPLERGRKSLFVERLEQVIDCMHVKSLQRVAIIRCDEDDERQARRIKGLDHLETVDLRHLHVQENEVGMV